MKKWLLLSAAALLAACDGGGTSVPAEGPGSVVEQFYQYIAEAKLKGGAAPVREAFKMISAGTSKLNQYQFVEIVKMYPPGFSVELAGTEINATKALVKIIYRLPSAFGERTVDSEVSLDLDPVTNSWKIDFTGENYGLGRDDLVATEGE